jgi:hypothetical protein
VKEHSYRSRHGFKPEIKPFLVHDHKSPVPWIAICVDGPRCVVIRYYVRLEVCTGETNKNFTNRLTDLHLEVELATCVPAGAGRRHCHPLAAVHSENQRYAGGPG